jgi:hypothetical protein
MIIDSNHFHSRILPGPGGAPFYEVSIIHLLPGQNFFIFFHRPFDTINRKKFQHDLIKSFCGGLGGAVFSKWGGTPTLLHGQFDAVL